MHTLTVAFLDGEKKWLGQQLLWTDALNHTVSQLEGFTDFFFSSLIQAMVVTEHIPVLLSSLPCRSAPRFLALSVCVAMFALLRPILPHCLWLPLLSCLVIFSERRSTVLRACSQDGDRAPSCPSNTQGKQTSSFFDKLVVCHFFPGQPLQV